MIRLMLDALLASGQTRVPAYDAVAAGRQVSSRTAKITGRDTLGGMPGFGADNAEYGSIPTLPANLKSGVRGQILHVPRITMESRFRKLFELADLGGQQFNEFGYMLYKP